MERLRKGTQREIHNDIRNVQKNLSLIRAPEGIRKKDKTAEQDSVLMDQDMEDEENIQYVDARELEKKLSAGKMEIADTEMIANWMFWIIWLIKSGIMELNLV